MKMLLLGLALISSSQAFSQILNPPGIINLHPQMSEPTLVSTPSSAVATGNPKSLWKCTVSSGGVVLRTYLTRTSFGTEPAQDWVIVRVPSNPAFSVLAKVDCKEMGILTKDESESDYEYNDEAPSYIVRITSDSGNNYVVTPDLGTIPTPVSPLHLWSCSVKIGNNVVHRVETYNVTNPSLNSQVVNDSGTVVPNSSLHCVNN